MAGYQHQIPDDIDWPRPQKAHLTREEAHQKLDVLSIRTGTLAKRAGDSPPVQMRLLPKESPHIPGYDIAGICIPAKEAGGDYYDFM